MDKNILNKLSLTKENLQDIVKEYVLLKAQNVKLLEKIENLTRDNQKNTNDLKIFKKIIAPNGVPKQLNGINAIDAIDMKQKINKFVNNIDECIAILSKH